MVRLKDILKQVKQSIWTISIPYGAIKRRTLHLLRENTFHISIPYGAIKRVKIIYEAELNEEFQFLMVRLKGQSSDEISNL